MIYLANIRLILRRLTAPQPIPKTALQLYELALKLSGMDKKYAHRSTTSILTVATQILPTSVLLFAIYPHANH